jgi:predicted metal-dependent phosphoesterase TrpH
MVADLHVHTIASDGRYTPAEVLQQAALAGLSYLAITDHDTLDGLLAITGAPSGGPLVIPGIEFSTDLPDCEVHILGYLFDPDNGELKRQIGIIAHNRLSRAERMIAKLATLGYPVGYDRVLALPATLRPGAAHVAAALVEAGYFPDVAAAFDAVLNRDRPGYVPHYKLTPAVPWR